MPVQHAGFAGGEARQLTNISTGVSDPLWSPDGKWIAFSTDVYPECGGDDACNKRVAETWGNGPLQAHMADELLQRHWNTWKDGTRTHTYVASVATGETRDLTPGSFDAPTFQLGGPIQYDFSPDGKEFVYVSNHDKELATSTNNDLWLISLTDKEARPRNITASNPAYDGSPKYSPDGKYIAHVINDGAQRSLWVRQVATAANKQLVPPAEVMYNGVAFSPDGNYV